ncbi:MAG: 5'-nucleotidase C-terminal domain-containing protein [Bacteroidales bacterium]
MITWIKVKTAKKKLAVFFLVFIILVISAPSYSQDSMVSSCHYRLDLIGSKYKTEANPIDSLLRPYRLQLHRIMGKIVGHTEALPLNNFPEGKLSNLTADIMEASLQRHKRIAADLALFNFRGLRKGLDSGAISLSELYEVYPFANELVYVQIQGVYLREIFELLLKNKLIGVSSSVQLQTDSSRSLISARIKGRVLKNNRIYNMVTIDYLMQPNAGIGPVMQAKKTESIGWKMRDEILEYIQEKERKGERVEAQEDGRIFIKP